MSLTIYKSLKYHHFSFVRTLLTQLVQHLSARSHTHKHRHYTLILRTRGPTPKHTSKESLTQKSRIIKIWMWTWVQRHRFGCNHDKLLPYRHCSLLNPATVVISNRAFCHHVMHNGGIEQISLCTQRQNDFSPFFSMLPSLSFYCWKVGKAWIFDLIMSTNPMNFEQNRLLMYANVSVCIVRVLGIISTWDAQSIYYMWLCRLTFLFCSHPLF